MFYLLILISLLIPNISNAQKYVPLVVDQIDQFNDLQNTTDFGTFLNGLFLFGLAIAAVLAVVMIIYGGVLYMGSESVFNKGEGKSKIQAAIGGLILALVSWLILNTINPDIISSTGRFEPSPVTLPEGDFGAGISGNFEPVNLGEPITDSSGNIIGYDSNGDNVPDYIPGGAGNTPSSFNNSLSVERSRFAQELASDPDLARLLYASTAAEVGSQSGAQLAYIESVMNRASATGRTLRSILTDPGYYPPETKNKLNRANPPNYGSLLSSALAGSNVSHYATDNASGGLANRRVSAGNPGVRVSGELFYTNINGSGDGGVPAHASWYNSHVSQ